MYKQSFVFLIILFSIQIFADNIWSGHTSYIHASNIIEKMDINESEQSESNSSVDQNLTTMFVWKYTD